MDVNCQAALELLSASLDGELTPQQESLLQAHLDQCPTCRALQAELAGLHAACGEMEVLPPPQLKERILADLPPQRSPKVIYWKRWGAMAAALALVALAAWRLPHSLYDKSVPTSSGVDTQSAELTVEVAPDADLATGVTEDADPAQPAVCSMEDAAIAVDADVPSAEAPTPLSLPVDAPADPDSAAKRTEEAPAASKKIAPAAEPLLTGNGDTAQQLPDNAPSPQAAGPQLRAVLFSAAPDPTYQVDGGDTDLVVEPDPLEGEAPVPAQPLETVAQDVRDFSRYSAVVVLSGVDFEGDYPRQRQENGDMWYLLPLDQLDSLPQPLDDTGAAYDLRREGDDLTPDAPYVLLIVPGEN